MKPEKKLMGLGFLIAILASLCCIAPILAMLAGTTLMISSFSWLAPLRPYLIGITILVLGFAWYQKLRSEKKIDCNCSSNKRITFFQTKKFLVIVTFAAAIMLAFPWFANIFYPKQMKQTMVAGKSLISTVEFRVSGMTCVDCEGHVNYEVNKLPGIINSVASYDNGNAIIKFDPTKTGIDQIKQAIDNTGYIATEKKELK